MNNVEQLRAQNAQIFPSVVEDLKNIIQIPSVSAIPAHQQDVARSAQFVADLFAAEGFDVEICHANYEDGTPGRPAVLGHKHVSEDAPTVLLYAHHDVQPVGDESRWQSAPFDPVVRGDRLFGRGSADDGAGIMAHVGAVRLLGADLPVNVTVFIEGEEEIGSGSFQNFLAKYQDRLQADLIIVADSGNWQVGTPAITTSLRGVVQMDVTLKVADHASHSGGFGGPMIDAVSLAAMLISTFWDENGDVAIAGLGGNDKAEVDYTEQQFRQDAGLLPGVKLAGTGDLAARLWTKPAVAVIGWDVRPLTEASNTIAPETTFRLSVRTVPGEDVAAAAAAISRHIKENVPFGADVQVRINEQGPSYLANQSQATQNLHDALSKAWQTEAVNIGQGGSIPFIADFASFFPDADVLVTGVEDPDSHAHSEDESVSLSDLENVVLAEALLLQKTAGR
ncbi:MAG: dipeptidase [Actinomycetaceae bacterium]|nr:dipeptidase [Actinomycetaceae bacterium]